MKFESFYTKIPNIILRDNRLKLESLGTFVYLMSHDALFDISAQLVADHFNYNIDTVRRYARELTENDYLTRKQIKEKNSNRILKHQWMLTDPFYGRHTPQGPDLTLGREGEPIGRVDIRNLKLDFDAHYAQIPNTWLRDSRLKLEELGYLVHLMSHAPGFLLSPNSVGKHYGIGRMRVYSIVEKLEELGYLQQTNPKREKATGRIVARRWVICDPFESKRTPTKSLAPSPVTAARHQPATQTNPETEVTDFVSVTNSDLPKDLKLENMPVLSDEDIIFQTPFKTIDYLSQNQINKDQRTNSKATNCDPANIKKIEVKEDRNFKEKVPFPSTEVTGSENEEKNDGKGKTDFDASELIEGQYPPVVSRLDDPLPKPEGWNLDKMPEEFRDVKRPETVRELVAEIDEQLETIHYSLSVQTIDEQLLGRLDPLDFDLYACANIILNSAKGNIAYPPAYIAKSLVKEPSRWYMINSSSYNRRNHRTGNKTS